MIKKTIILFDGVCNLCCGWVRFLIRHDKKGVFKFVSLQSEEGIQFTKRYNIDTKVIDSIIYIRDNQSFIESDAVFEIIRDLSGIWKVFLIFRIMPKQITDFIYKKIAKNRYLIFGKRSTCLVPTRKNKP